MQAKKPVHNILVIIFSSHIDQLIMYKINLFSLKETKKLNFINLNCILYLYTA